MKTLLFFTGFFLLVSQSSFSQWIQQGADIDGEAAEDQSGFSVSLNSDGTIMAIGAPYNDGNGNNSGHVRIYEFDGLNWNQLGTDINGEAADDQSGWSVSLNNDGTILAIGAHLNNGNGADSGHVRIYEFNGADWIQLGTDIDGEAADDWSGRSVSLSDNGNIVAIGAPLNGDNGFHSGHVRVYEFNGADWVQLGNDIDGEVAGDQSGWSVSLSSNGAIVAIGARTNDGNGVDSGHVRIYQFDGANWLQLGTDIDGEASLDLSGLSISLSSNGNIVAIGARHNDGNGDNSGHVRIYEFNGVDWNQMGSDINGEAVGDESGWSVSLNSNGNIVAIGARLNNGNGNNSGHVRIYEFNGADWVQLGSDLNGEVAGDQSGWSVSLNSNGNIVAIGAYLNDDNGNYSGHVRVYGYPAPVIYTQIPDPNFEQALIDQGIDSEGILDGQVLTSDISGVTDLAIPNLSISDLSGIENFTALQTLICNGNNLAYADLSENNNLVTLDISNNRSLAFLDCSNNNLTSLDVAYTYLRELRCNGNLLTSINIIDVGNLGILYCNDNQITTLELFDNNDLQLLNCSNNQLNGSLDLSKLTELQYFDATGNPNLNCIQVENPEVVSAGEDVYVNWLKDPAAIYSDDCAGVGMIAAGTGISGVKNIKNAAMGSTTGQLAANTIAVYPNPAKDYIRVALPAEKEFLGVIIYNMQGEKLAEARSTRIDTAHLAEGVYFMEIQLSNPNSYRDESIIKKVMISRD